MDDVQFFAVIRNLYSLLEERLGKIFACLSMIVLVCFFLVGVILILYAIANV